MPASRMRRWWSTHLRGNHAIGLACLALIGLAWIITLERITYERADAAAEESKKNSNLTLALEEHTARTLKGVDQTLLFVKHEYEQEHLKLDLRRLIREGEIDTSLFIFIGVADERGRLILGSGNFAPTFLGDRNYFKVHQGRDSHKMFIDKPVLGRVTGLWAIPMARRVNKPDGSFGGVVYAAVDPAYFTNFYQRANLGERGLVTLVGLDGITRARRAGDVATFGEDMRSSTLFAEQARNPNGSFISVGRLDGTPRFYSYRTMREYPLIVAMATSQAETLAEFHKRERNYYLGAGLTTALTMIFAAGLVIALSRQRRASDALVRSETQFRATFDQAAVGITHVALDGRFLRANQKYCSLIGYTEEELRARTILDVTYPADRYVTAGLRKLLVGYGSGPASPVMEKRNVRKDGSLIWVSVTVSAVGDSEARPEYLLGIVQDITGRKEAEERYRATFNQAAVGIGHTARDGRFIEANANLARMLGYTQAELVTKNFRDIIPPEELAAADEDRTKLGGNEVESSVREFHYVRKDGSRGWAIRTLSPVRDPSGNIGYFITVVQDITQRKQAEEALVESQDNFEQLAQHIPDAFWITDARREKLVYISPAYERIWGRKAASIDTAWREWRDSIHSEDRERTLAAYRDMRDGNLDLEYRILRPDGTARWVHARGFPVIDADGTAYRVVGTIEDITERKELQERLIHQANFDTLTQLPNRALCYDRLKQALGQAQRRIWNAGVLFLDLDRFKVVNDTLGHVFGDQLLQEVAKRLATCVRAGDTVGRLGGDEFVIVLPEIAHSHDAAVVAQKVLAELARPFGLGEHEVFVTASVGIATYPGDGTETDSLLKNADAAMFSAKDLGRNNYQFYTAAMNERALEKLVLESNLRRALERNEFLLHFQPKASLTSGEVTGCEALLRWKIPDTALVSPAQFIPLLEESGLIVPVGEWVIRSACEQIRAWLEAGVKAVPIAVNLSAKQFQHQDICTVVERALRDSRVEARLLELEITESAAMHDAEDTIATLRKLKALGVSVSIDDFGTGYSSLAYLKRFPVDFLKLDQSFVTGLPTDPDDVSIARAVITLAHSLDLKVIAEGVETREQLAFLATNRCDEMQGYYFSRPLPAAECTQLLSHPRKLALLAARGRARKSGHPETA
jgi:diguanylate cyclase (GGDEF)-like protein/PAS domain S-box-containing protein